MMKRMAVRGAFSFPVPGPNLIARLQQHLPTVIAVLFGLSGAAAISAVLAPGLPALIFLSGAAVVGLIVVYGYTTGALAGSAAPHFGTLAIRILEDLPEACLITRRDGGLVFTNAAYERLCSGLGAEHPLPFERLIVDQEGAAKPIYRLARAARDGRTLREQVPVTLAAGGRTWLEVEVRPVPGFQHRVMWRLIDQGSVREAGARQEALRMERDGLIRALDHLPVGLLTFDSAGGVLYANETLQDLTGAGAGALEGVGLDHLFAGSPEAIRDHLRQAAEDGAPVELALRSHDAAMGGETSQRVLVRARTDVSADDHPVLHLALWPRVADTPRDEDLPANSLGEFLEHAPIGILILDEDGEIRMTNPAMGTLFAESGPDAATVEDLILPDDRDALSDLVRTLRDDRSERNGIEVRLAGSGDDAGQTRNAQIFVSRLDPVPGGAGHLIFYFIDTTRQKSLEQQFAQSQKMQAIGQLAGGVAHDFNNLLTAIIGFCDLLLTRHQAGDPSFGDISQIKQNGLRAANLTRQLLAFSRRQTLRPKRLQLTDVLTDLSMLLRRLIGETITLDIHHDRDLGMVTVDQGQLEQVVINLAVNARDAMPDGGTLEIRTANVAAEDVRGCVSAKTDVPDGSYVEIVMRDTGCGIPAAHMGRIFEPFFTTKNDETVGKGTGLGLSTVYGIIQQTGGFIAVDSEVGTGTTFRIYLPRDMAEPGTDADLQPKEEPRSRDLTGAGTVLLVEDEDAVRMFTTRALQSRGYTVLEAANGEAALEIVAEEGGAIDLVLSDVMMPGMDGPTMALKLRKDYPDMKIVFISGYAESAFQKALDKPEEFHFLPKPFTLKQLAETVKEVMSAA